MIAISGNFDEVIKRFKERKKLFKDRNRKFLTRLGEEGISLANAKIENIQYDGDNDTVVEPLTWDGDKLILAASGQAITFIEFGTGVHYSERHPMEGFEGMTRGTFGRGLGSRDYWHYIGNPGTHGEVVKNVKHGVLIRTHGNPPNRIVYDTAKEVRQKITEIAKEVYVND